DLETLGKVIGKDLSEIGRRSAELEEIGVIERQGNTIKIAFSPLAALVYRTLSRQKRVRLAEKIFHVLRENQSDIQGLAHCAFEAGLFKESGGLYLQLAGKATDLKNFKEAAAHYERLEACEKLGG